MQFCTLPMESRRASDRGLSAQTDGFICKEQPAKLVWIPVHIKIMDKISTCGSVEQESEGGGEGRRRGEVGGGEE